MFFVNEEARETVLDYSKETVEVFCFYFILISYYENEPI